MGHALGDLSVAYGFSSVEGGIDTSSCFEGPVGRARIYMGRARIRNMGQARMQNEVREHMRNINTEQRNIIQPLTGMRHHHHDVALHHYS